MLAPANYCFLHQELSSLSKYIATSEAVVFFLRNITRPRPKHYWLYLWSQVMFMLGGFILGKTRVLTSCEHNRFCLFLLIWAKWPSSCLSKRSGNGWIKVVAAVDLRYTSLTYIFVCKINLSVTLRCQSRYISTLGNKLLNNLESR